MPPEIEAYTQAEPAPDIRSLIEAAVEAQDAGHQDDASSDGSRARDANGRFVGTQSQDEPEADPVDAAPEADAAPEPEPAAEPAIEPPPTWAQADKDQFKALPPEAQSILLQRHRAMEADYTRKTQDAAELRREFEPVSQIFAPYRDIMRQKGFTPAALIGAYVDVEKRLTNPNDAPNAIVELINNYRVDRSMIARALGLSSPAPGVDAPPAPDGQGQVQLPPELMQTLQTFHQKAQSFDQFIAQQQQERAMSEANRVMSTIEQFAAEKSPDGQPLHPHFADVEGQMALIASGFQARGEAIPPLRELYDQAVWATPSTREKMLTERSAASQAQQKAMQQKAQAEARAKMEKSRRAGSSVTGASDSGQRAVAATSNGSASIRAALEAAFDEHANA